MKSLYITVLLVNLLNLYLAIDGYYLNKQIYERKDTTPDYFFEGAQDIAFHVSTSTREVEIGSSWCGFPQEGWTRFGEVATYYFAGIEKLTLPICGGTITHECVLPEKVKNVCQ